MHSWRATPACPLPPEAFPNIRGLAPASVSIVTCENGFQALTAWNDIGHLLCADGV